MKIGRAPLDEEAVRLIEELNPFVEFDWVRIRKGQDQPPSEPRVPVEVRRSRGPRGQERHEARQEARPESRQDHRQEPASPPLRTPPEIDAPLEEFSDFKDALHADPAPAPSPEPVPDVPIPDVIVAAHARIGAEGVARLRARYAEIAARIAERISDPERRDTLKAQAVRLSPDAWTTDAEVTQALDEYESVLASLREVVGRKRRRRRRGGSRGPESADVREAGSSSMQDPVREDAQESDEDGQTNESSGPSESREEPEDTGL